MLGPVFSTGLIFLRAVSGCPEFHASFLHDVEHFYEFLNCLIELLVIEFIELYIHLALSPFGLSLNYCFYPSLCRIG